MPLIHSVRCGCWLISYRPSGAPLVAFDGTLRVECHSAGRTASGDLYQRPVIILRHSRSPSAPPRSGPGRSSQRPILLSGPNPANGIPILPRVPAIATMSGSRSCPSSSTSAASFTLGFELWRFTAPNSWALELTLTAQMTRMTAPTGYPSPSDYAEGDVKNAGGTVVGRLTMGWLSSYFRRCTVEIDTVNGSEQPTNSGVGHTWQSVMDAVGWQVNVQLSDTNVAEASGASWSDAEMHAAMLARRSATNLDTEWRYHVLAVKNIDSTPRGIMYDVGRHRLEQCAARRRRHRLALDHRPDLGHGRRPAVRHRARTLLPYRGARARARAWACSTTSPISASCARATSSPTPARPQLRSPAISMVIPSRQPEAAPPLSRTRSSGPAVSRSAAPPSTTPPITPTDLEVDVGGLELEVSPLLAEVPLGAPVRVGINLVNRGDPSDPGARANLSLKGEFVGGR